MKLNLRLRGRIKQLEFPEYILVCLILLQVCFGIFFIFSFKSLPSPIYGGDLYYQLGSVINAVDGGNPLESSVFSGKIPGYLPMYSVFVMIVSKITFSSPVVAMYLASIIIGALSTLSAYFLLFLFFRDKYLAVFGAIQWLLFQSLPVIKYTEFTSSLLMPVFFIACYFAFSRKNLPSIILLGVSYGLLSIGHVTAFVSASLFLVLMAVKMILVDNFSFKDSKLSIKLANLRENLKLFFITAAVGIPISMLYWFKPFFIYRLHFMNDQIRWGQIDLSQNGLKIQFLLTTLKSVLFNFSSVLFSFRTILIWAGLFYLVARKSKSPQEKEIVAWSLSFFIIIFSYFITEPILKTNFAPAYISNMLLPVFCVLVSAIGIKFSSEEFAKCRKTILFAAIFLMLALNVYSIKAWGENPWINVGKNPFSPEMQELQKYVRENTGVNDVFLSQNELGFMLNALTGRKLMISRRAQNNDPFMDFEKLNLDAAIVLFGNDSKNVRDILDKYKIRYLLWSPEWISMDYRYDQQSGSAVPFDPIIIKYSPEAEQKLIQNNVSYLRSRGYIDPTFKGPEFRDYDIIYVIPNMNLTNPWGKTLNNFLKPIKNINNQFVIYEVVNT